MLASLPAKFQEHFRQRLVPEGECLVWTGRTYRRGYGRVRIDGHERAVHRVAWMMVHGAIPEGLLVCHRCDNPPCCRVDHLFLGTMLDNARDSKAKGRTLTGKRNKGGAPPGSRCGAAKLTEADIPKIRVLAIEGVSQREIGRRFGVTQKTIWPIIHRKTWKHVP